MTDLGLLKQFLGLEIDKYEEGIKFRQHKYATNIILKFKMDEFKASNCPFLSGIKLGAFGSFPLVDSSLYIHLVGSLLCLTHSQKNLAYIVGIVARYIQNLHEIH